MLSVSFELTPLSGLFFFFADSSRALTPFASPGTGPDSFRIASRAGFGFLKICTNRLVSAFQWNVGVGSARTHNRMLRLIMLALEI